MDNKIIFKNWRQFITEEEKLSNLTPKEREELKSAVKNIKAYIMGTLAREMHENLEERARPGRKLRAKRLQKKRNKQAQELVSSLVSQGIIKKADINKDYDQLTPSEKKAYDKALASSHAADRSDLFTGDILQQRIGISPGSRIHKILTTLAGTDKVNLNTIMDSPLASLFSAIS